MSECKHTVDLSGWAKKGYHDTTPYADGTHDYDYYYCHNCGMPYHDYLRVQLEAAEIQNKQLRTVVMTEMTKEDLKMQLADMKQDRDNLQAQLREEQEAHAQLQARCYEGFPSVTDGIFDAYKNMQAQLIEHVKTHTYSDETVKMMEDDLHGTITDLQAQVGVMREALEELARLGGLGGNYYGNSIGNDIARRALEKYRGGTDKPQDKAEADTPFRIVWD